MPDFTSSLGQTAPPPEPTATSTGFGLGVPNPVNLPLTGTPVEGSPVPPPQQQTPAPEHVAGRVFGKLLNGLSGEHNEYAIDPATGKQTTVAVKEKPGQTFRSLLAYGLLGAQGVGEKEGDHTFAQGLLSGLGGGMKASTEGQQKLDDQRRQQAQLQYADQLKAAENNREDKKLSLQEQLNKVQIANFNQEQAARAITMDKAQYDLSREKGTDEAAPLLHSSEMQIAADAPKVQGYKELGIDALASNLTEDQLHKYVADHPGAATEQMGLHTDTKVVLDPKTGKATVQPLYTIYPAINKVPPSLLEGLKAVGASEKGNRLNPMYNSLSAAQQSGSTVDTGKIVSAYRELTNYEKIQSGALDTKVKLSEIRARDAEAYVHSLEAQYQKFNLTNAVEGKEAGDLLKNHYDPADNTLKNTQDLGIDPKTHQLVGLNSLTGNNPATNKPWTQKDKQEIQRKRDLLGKAISGFYFDKLDEYSKLSKVTKDENGDLVSNNPQINALGTEISGLASARDILLGGNGTPAAAGAASTNPQVVKTIKYFQDSKITDPRAIQQQLQISGVPPAAQLEIYKGLGLTPPPPRQPLSPLGQAVVKGAEAAYPIIQTANSITP